MYFVWAQNISKVSRLIIHQKKVLRIINLKDYLFHPGPLFSTHNILKFGEKITLENIILPENQSTDKCLLCFTIGLYLKKPTYI